MMKIRPSIILLAAMILTACLSTPEHPILTVSAAASLTNAFTEIGAAFEDQKPGVTVALNFAASSTLRAQLGQGAPVDVFASANRMQMDLAVEEGTVDSDAPHIFLTNSLVLALPPDNPARIASFEDLTAPGVHLVLAAPEVPAGRYARQVLENLDDAYGAGYAEAVLANLVSNEDTVRQTLAKIQLGEADVGMVFISDLLAAPELLSLPVPDGYNVEAQYPIAVVNGAAQPELAHAFIEFVLSDDGQQILTKWGFTPVNTNP
jgi:molybdate transport system substrate-binding protein